jgi:hypothetical protein
MKQYQVTLNFTFNPHHCDVGDFDDTESVNSDESASSQNEDKAKYEAFQRTDRYYQTHNLIEHIKSNDPLGFVEYVVCDGEVVSAEWDKENFAIHMVVDTNQTEQELENDLRSNSLEDGEYEACGETGWLIFTRGPNNEVFDSPWDCKKFWEYGLTDYRLNPIQIHLLGEKSEVHEC